LAASILLLGFAARLGFDRWKIPDFLVLVVAGLVIGPTGLNVLPADMRAGIDGAAPLFLAVAVAFLMMEAGIQVSLRGGRFDVLLVMAHTAVAAALTLGLAWGLLVGGFGLTSGSAIVLAAATLGPSAVVLASFAPKLSIRPETRRTLLFEGVIANVLSFLVVMSVPGLAAGPSGPGAWAAAAMSLVLAVVLAVLAAFLWSLVLARLHPREGIFIATLAVALVVYAEASGPLGGNGAIAAFAFGAALRKAGGIEQAGSPAGANSKAPADLGRFHSEAAFLVRSFFFLYLGLLFVPADFSGQGLAIVFALLAAFFIARLPSCLMVGRVWGLGKADTLILTGSVSRGLTDVLVVLYGISAGLVAASESGLMASVIIILLLASLAANGLVIWVAERVRGREPSTGQGEDREPPAPG
jgi:cell volume regulation protein A